MKHIVLLPFLMLSLSAWGKTLTIKISSDKEPQPNSWHCSVKAFMNGYESFGSSKTEAKYRTIKKCKEANDEMHCQDVQCEGEDSDPVASGNKGWVCKLSAFTDDYEVLGNTKTEAKYKVAQKCKADHDEMHCRDVKCSTDDE